MGSNQKTMAKEIANCEYKGYQQELVTTWGELKNMNWFVFILNTA